MFKKIDYNLHGIIRTLMVLAIIISGKTWSAEQEFNEAITRYPASTFAKTNENINDLIRAHPDTVTIGKDQLTMEEAWQGIKWKAERPEQFVPVIRASRIIDGTRQKTFYGETFTRVSWQQWLAEKEIEVKEEVHIFEDLKKVLFLGRLVESESTVPLFHVEHGLKTEDDNLFNTWRIVFLISDEKLPFDNSKFQGSSVGIYLETLRQLSQ